MKNLLDKTSKFKSFWRQLKCGKSARFNHERHGKSRKKLRIKIEVLRNLGIEGFPPNKPADREEFKY